MARSDKGKRRVPRWTPEDDAQLAEAYRTSTLDGAAAQFPGRTRHGVMQRISRLGLVKSRRWSGAEDERLHELWLRGASAEEMQRELGRGAAAIYMRARYLRLYAIPPAGCEFMRDAVRRSGFGYSTLLRILSWAGVEVRMPMHSPRASRARCRLVRIEDVNAAIARYVRCETAVQAAARHHVALASLREWMNLRHGSKPWRYYRLDPDEVDRVVAENRRRPGRPRKEEPPCDRISS